MSALSLAGNGMIFATQTLVATIARRFFQIHWSCQTMSQFVVITWAAHCMPQISLSIAACYTIGFEPDNFSDFSRQRPVAKERLGALIELVRNESYGLICGAAR